MRSKVAVLMVFAVMIGLLVEQSHSVAIDHPQSETSDELLIDANGTNSTNQLAGRVIELTSVDQSKTAIKSS